MQSNEPTTRTLSLSYGAVHTRIKTKRGSARNYVCIAPDCGEQAVNWAWQHTGPFVQSEPDHLTMARIWGTEIEDYAPMCHSHANRLDQGGTLTHCSAGHLRTPENTYTHPTSGKSTCFQCRKDKDRVRGQLRPRKDCPHCGKSLREQHFNQHVRSVHRHAVTDQGEGKNA